MLLVVHVKVDLTSLTLLLVQSVYVQRTSYALSPLALTQSYRDGAVETAETLCSCIRGGDVAINIMPSYRNTLERSGQSV